MSRQGVDTRSDELVTLLLDPLRRVVEVRSRRRHGCGPHDLSKDDQYQADADGEEVDETSLIRRIAVRKQYLAQSSTVGGIVRCAIAEQEEAARAYIGQIVSRRRPELEEVEETERGSKYEQTPDGAFKVDCLDSEDQRGGEDKSEPEGLSADV